VNICRLIEATRSFAETAAPKTGANPLPLAPCSPDYAVWRYLITPIQESFGVDVVCAGLSRRHDGLSDMCFDMYRDNRISTPLTTRTVYVKIAGAVDRVVEARQVLEHLFESGWHALTHPGLTRNFVSVPDWAFDAVSQGVLVAAEVHHIQKQWGVGVHLLPAVGSQIEYAVLGLEPAVRRASAYMQRLTEAACNHLLHRQHSGGDIAVWWSTAPRPCCCVVQDQPWNAVSTPKKIGSARSHLPPRRSHAFDADQAASAQSLREARRWQRQQQRRRTRTRDQEEAVKSSIGMWSVQ